MAPEQLSRSAVPTRMREHGARSTRNCASLWRLWPSPRFVAPVGPDRTLPLPCYARRSRKRCRYLSLYVQHLHLHLHVHRRKKPARSELCVVGSRTTASHRLFGPCCWTSVCHGPAAASYDALAFPGRVHEVVLLLPVVPAFPSLRPRLSRQAGSNTFAVTRLLQWLCHVHAGTVAQGLWQDARQWLASPLHEMTPSDSYSRRVAASQRCATHELNASSSRIM